MKTSVIWRTALVAPLLWATISRGAIDPGSFNGGTMGELFLEVWDGETTTDGDGNTVATGKSYIKDLGITVEDLLTNPAGFETETPYPIDNLPATAIWGVKALNDDGFASRNALGDPTLGETYNDPANFSGILTTVVESSIGIPIDDQNISFDQLTTPLAAAIPSFNNGDADFSKNQESTFSAGDTAFLWLSGSDASVQLQTSLPFGTTDGAKGSTLPMYFLTARQNDIGIDSVVVGRDKKAVGYWTYDGQTLKFSRTAAASKCPLPWDSAQSIDSGKTVVGYKTESAANCDTEKSTLTCQSDGTFSPSGSEYPFASCTTTQPTGCKLPWSDETIAEGESVTAYPNETSANCEAEAVTRTCSGGVLDGDSNADKPSCSANTALGCPLPWDTGQTVADGASIDAYQAGTADTEEACAALKESRACSNGTLSGSFTFENCTASASAGKSCSLPGSDTPIPDGTKVSGFKTPFSANCEANIVEATCTDGSFDTDLNSSGFSATCIAPIDCDLPWGGKLADGARVTAYQATSSVSCASISEVRTCSRGVLSGELTERKCAYPVTLLSPAAGDEWKVGIRQLIKWESAGLDSKRRLFLEFSRDGGITWKRLRNRLPLKGDTVWLPKRRAATEQARLRVCIAPTKTNRAETPICSESGGDFVIQRR